MIFMLLYMLVFFGLFLAGFLGLMPLGIQVQIPEFLRVVFFFVGIVIAMLGVSTIHGRAKKTGADHLLEFGKPGTILWFYVYRDGTVKITPSMREVEGQLYCKELDAQVNDLKSYRLFDHSIRFVPEGIGHAVDLDMVLYTTLLRNKYGFTNMREVREGGFKLLGYPKDKSVQSEEHFVGG